MEFIEIKGNYFETGYKIGSLQKDYLKKLEKSLSALKFTRVQKEKIKKLEEIWKKFRDIREELEGYCKGADIQFETLLKLKAVDRKLFSENCTSFFLSSGYTCYDNVALKIRDELPFLQYGVRKQNFGRTPYFFASSVGNTGIAFFMKTNGFTGINNTGSFLIDREINQVGFDDCDLMRIIAELADTPEDAVEIVEKLIKEKLIGVTGRNRGMIFLFTKGEKAIYLENSSFSCALREIKKKITFTNDFQLAESQNWTKNVETESTKSSLLRKKRLDEILNKKCFDIESILAITRDLEHYPYSICRDTSLTTVRTISAFLAVSGEASNLLICLGHPFVSFFFPVSVDEQKIMKDVVSGEMSCRLNLLFEKKGIKDKDFLKKIEDFERKIIKLDFKKAQELARYFIQQEMKSEGIHNS
jgi:hypothetical protein